MGRLPPKSAKLAPTSSSKKETPVRRTTRGSPIKMNTSETPIKKSGKKKAPPKQSQSSSSKAHVSDDEDPVKKTEEELQAEGTNVFAIMNPTELNELLERIDTQCSPLDTLSVKKREQIIDWEKVAFSSYGPRQCEAVWVFLRHHTRSIRILYEVVNEVKVKLAANKSFQTKLIESMPGYPQKPPTSLGGFHYFNRKEWEKQKSNVSSKDLPNFVRFQRECREKYNAFSEQEKQKYDDLSATALADYQRRVKEFYVKNPGLAQYVAKLHEQNKILKSERESKKRERRKSQSAGGSSIEPRPRKIKKEKEILPNPYEDAPQFPLSPTALFIQSKLNRLVPPPTAEELPILKNKFFDKWKGFSNEKRCKWINAAVTNCQEYLENVEEYQQIHPGYAPSKFVIRQVLSKDELSIWESEHGKPNNPKLAVFDLFYEEFSKESEYSNLPEDEKKKIALTKWNEIDWYNKQMFGMKYKISLLEYKKKLQSYFSQIPDFLKDECLKRVSKRYHKLLEDVDIVPDAESEQHLDLDHLAEYNESYAEQVVEEAETDPLEQEPPRKKRKKDKKKIKQKEEEGEDNNSTEVNAQNYEEEDYTIEETIEQEEVKEEGSESSPKKKKKKKSHKRHNNEVEPETITEDIFSDSQSEYGESGGGRRGESVKRNLFGKQKSQHHIGLSKKPEYDIQVKKTVKAEVNKMKMSGDQPISMYKEQKPSTKNFNANSSILQKDMYEAVRGIFDGRAHLARLYSPYYYYAKYVCTEKFWIDSVNTKGLTKTAVKIIQTFQSQEEYPKERFIEKSFRFHQEKRHKLVHSNFERFPGEPDPPPRKASELYKAEKYKKKRKEIDLSWEDLPEKVKMYYIKKLYHDTRVYLKRFDMFMSSMTPNDLVEYTCMRARQWEEQLYTKQTLLTAVREFIFPLKKQELYDIGNESDMETSNQKVDRRRSKVAKRKLNPFADCDQIISKLTKKIPQKKKPAKDLSESDDDPSDEEDPDFMLYHDRLSLECRRKRKIKEAGRYLYPLDDILPETEMQKPITKKNKSVSCNMQNLLPPIKPQQRKPVVQKPPKKPTYFEKIKDVKRRREHEFGKSDAQRKRTVASCIRNIACNVVAPKVPRRNQLQSRLKQSMENVLKHAGLTTFHDKLKITDLNTTIDSVLPHTTLTDQISAPITTINSENTNDNDSSRNPSDLIMETHQEIQLEANDPLIKTEEETPFLYILPSNSAHHITPLNPVFDGSNDVPDYQYHFLNTLSELTPLTPIMEFEDNNF